MRRFCGCGYFLLLLLFVPLLSGAETLHTETVLLDTFDQLQSAAQGIQSLSSDFVQEKHLAIFSETLRSKGRFIYRKPDYLRWELLSPVSSGFVLRGQQGERWNGLSKETSSFRVDSDPMMGIIARQLFAWAKVDIGWLQSRYRIELVAEQPVRLQLFPLDQGESGFIEQLQILFAADNSHVEVVEMYEAGGDKTLLRFVNVEMNHPLPAEDFKAPEFR